MLDVLIRNGWVADGTGSPPFLGDVAVEEGRITEVGRLGDGATAERVIDATGKVVCPGFVDPHSHSDFSLLANPTAESTIRQGVTTEVVGNCGWSYAPISDHSREYMSGRLHTFGYDGPVIPWTTFGEHLDFLADVGHSPEPGVVRRAQLDQARRRCLGLAPDRGAGCVDGPLHAGGDGGRRARHVDRARVQPGPRGHDSGARPPERDRRRVRRDLHEPRPQP